MGGMAVPHIFGTITGTSPIEVPASYLDDDFAALNRVTPSITDFGVAGDGITDDTAAVQTALNSLGVSGGTIRLPASCKCLVGNLTIPANVRILGDLAGPDADTLNTAVNFQNLGSAFYTLPGTTFTPGGAGVTIERCLMSPSTIKGAQQPNTSLFAGTCFTNTIGAYGCAIIGCAILGYAKAVLANQVSRIRFEWNAVDANAVLDITGSFDTTRIINNHCWPYLTIVAYSATPTASLIERSGTGFDFKTGSPDTWVDGNLLLGYLVGISCNNTGSINFGSNWIDHPSGQNRSGNIGVQFIGGVGGILCGQFYIFSCKEALVADTGAAGGTASLKIVNLVTEQTDSNAVRWESGNLNIGYHAAKTIGGAAIQVNTASGYLQLDDWNYTAITSNPPINCGVASVQDGNLRLGQGFWDGAAGAKLVGGSNALIVPTISSGTTLSIPVQGTMFSISGTTTITAINGGWAGRQITLFFLDALTVTHNSATLVLSGGVNYVTFAASTLTIRATGENAWVEVSRQKRDGTPAYASQSNPWSVDQVFTQVFAAGQIATAGTAGIGYTTGAGGTQSQGSGSGKATTVVLNKTTGAITTDNGNLNANTTVSFTLTNSTIAAADIILMNHISGGTAGAYHLNAQPTVGGAVINIRNITAGALAEAIVIAFAVIKGATS